MTAAYLASALGAIVCLAAFAYVWRQNNGGTTIGTPVVLFCLFEILMNWPAAFLAPAQGRASSLYTFALSLIGFAAFLVGVLVYGAITHRKSSAAIDYHAKPIGIGPDPLYFIGAIALGVPLIIAGLVFYRGVPPLLDAIGALVSNGSDDSAAIALGESRRALTKAHYFGGEYRGQGLLRALLRVGWSYLTAVALVLFVGTRRRAWAIAGGVAFVLTFLFVAGEGTRAPFAFAVVFLVITLSLVRRLPFRTVVTAATLSFVLLVGLSLASMKLRWALGRDDAVKVMVTSLVERIAYSNGLNTVYIIELVEDGVWDLRYGAVHAQRLLNAIPGVQAGPPLSYELYRTMNPYGLATTYYSATYLGDVYLDFGLPGVALMYLLMGVLVAAIEPVFFSWRKTVLGTVTTAYLTFSVAFIPLTGVIGFLSTVPLILLMHFIMTVSMSVFAANKVHSPRLAVSQRYLD